MASAKIPTSEAPVTIRVRTLTAKGHDLYLNMVHSLDKRVALAKGNVVECINAGDYSSSRNSFDKYSDGVLEYMK